MNVETLKEMYPRDTKIELIHIDDPQAPAPGTCGTVTHVDDMGTIHVAWENGCGLGLIYDVDFFKIVE